MRDARKPEVHVDGLGFPEGPVSLTNGGVAFVDLLDQKVRVYKDGQARDLCTVQGSPNGMRLGPDGALYIANNGGLSPRREGGPRPVVPQISGRLQRLTLDGRCADYAVNLPGEPPWRPNDLVFTPNGEIVFTDPQNWEDLAKRRAGLPHTPYRGGQLLLRKQTGAVIRLTGMTGFPNGLAFHPDGSLIVGLTVEHRLLRFPWRDAAVGPAQIWCEFDEAFGPDGMIFHEDKLYVTGSDGDRIAILDLTGRVIDTIVTPPRSVPTNLCIQGDILWVTFGIGGQLASYRL